METIEQVALLCADFEQNDGLQILAHTNTPSPTVLIHVDTKNLQDLARRAQSYKASAKYIQSRAEKVIDTLTDGVNQKGQHTAASISESLLRLTERSVDDNMTVRVVTIITLIYLPTQFVATFFGANFVLYQQGKRTIQLAKNFWIFLAIAIPLTLLTLTVWLLASRRKPQANRRARDAFGV